MDKKILTNSNNYIPPIFEEIYKDINIQQDSNTIDKDFTNINNIIEQNSQHITNKLIFSSKSVDHIKRPISTYASSSDAENISLTENPINTTPTKRKIIKQIITSLQQNY